MKYILTALMLMTSSMSFASKLCKTNKEAHKGHHQINCKFETKGEEESAKKFSVDAYRSTHSQDGKTDEFSRTLIDYQGLVFELFTTQNVTINAYLPTAEVKEGHNKFCATPDKLKEATLKFQDKVAKISSNDSRVGKKTHTSKWSYQGKTIEINCEE